MKNSLLLILCFACSGMLFAQSVGINTNTPNPSAALDVTSTTQGVLVPRMTSSQRTMISNPATGLLVFDMTTNSFWFKGNTVWIELIDSSNAPVQKNGNNLFMAIGGGYVGVGTTNPTEKLDVQGNTNISGALAVGAFGVGGIIGAAGVAAFGGAVGIGTATPSADLDVEGDAKISGGLAVGALGVGGLFGAAGVAAFGGAVGIGTATPSPSAALEIAADDKGFLKPRMTTADRLAIPNPAEGLEVYDTDTESPWYRDADEWKEVRHDSIVNVEVYRNGADKIYMAMTDSVGIGISTPNYKLQVATDGDEYGIAQTSSAVTVSTRIANGNSGAIGTKTNHPFSLYANNVPDQLVLMPSGNIGIGNNNPTSPLSFASGNGSKIALTKVGANEYGLGVAPNAMQLYVPDATNSIEFGSGNANSFSEKMRITGAGQVGLGNSAPHGDLQFANTANSRKIVLFEENNNANEFTGIGTGANVLRYQVNDTIADHVFYAGINNANSKELMRIRGNANVGFGVSAPDNTIDIQGGPPRTGTHPNHRSLYVTDNMDDAANGIEFRTSDATQGIGFGKNTIYAAGSNATQNLGLAAKGTTGNIQLSTNGAARLSITGAGNVGIGTTSANAPLQFTNTDANRKIVVSETANNDNQFRGIGTNANAMRYQVASTAESHIFYAGTSNSASTELVRITGDGNVGIGNSAQNARLDVSRGTGSDGTAILRGTTFYSHFNFSTAENTYIRGGKTGANVIINDQSGLGNVGIGTETPQQKLQVEGSAYITDKVGIGVSSPVAALQFANIVDNRKIVLWQGNNNENEFYGLGINPSQLRYQVDNANSSHVFYAGTSSTNSNELMRIKGNGNVGINNPNPSEKLEVGGNVKVSGTALLGYEIVQVTVNVPGYGGGGEATATCDCPPGKVVLGGGFYADLLDVIYAAPNSSGTAWEVKGRNLIPLSNTPLTAWAFCARIGN